MKTWILQALLFLIFFFSVERFCHRETHGFRLHKIGANLPHNSDWETLLPGDHEIKKLQKILSQSFSFLGSGGESYAFVSADGKYVLKFFKLHHMRPKNPEDFLLPPFLRTKLQKARRQKLDSFFSSCKLAYERFRKGTGLLYLHLNRTDILHTRLKLFDAIGARHILDIDAFPFALQEKATLAYPTLTSLIEARETEAAKRRIASLVDLIVMRASVGLSDHDPRRRNFGFIGENAIEFDLGCFCIDEHLKTPNGMKKSLLKDSLQLRKYIEKRHPELTEFLDEKINFHLTQKKSIEYHGSHE